MLNFKYNELIHSDTANRNGINNNPSLKLMDNMLLTIVMLQKVRELLGVPMVISSGYRCSELNKLVGGSNVSKHMEFLAIDFIPKMDINTAYRKIINSDIKYDKVILEKNSKGSVWIHIQFSKTPRKQHMELEVK
ncbi:MAG: D-Ala-D-Ala carboxypeptidase family metallohydrolase [Cetobacterium somerae]